MRYDDLLEVHTIAIRLKLHPDTIRTHIREKRLKAFDFSNGKGKPCYRIAPKDYEEFVNSMRK